MTYANQIGSSAFNMPFRNICFIDIMINFIIRELLFKRFLVASILLIGNILSAPRGVTRGNCCTVLILWECNNFGNFFGWALSRSHVCHCNSIPGLTALTHVHTEPWQSGSHRENLTILEHATKLIKIKLEELKKVAYILF